MEKGLSERHEEWLVLERGLDPEIVAHGGIYSVRRGEDGGVVPDRRGNILAFAFRRDGKEIATKYRTADKRMWQSKGGAKTLYNADVLDDPALADGRVPLVITEGEIDALSAITAGHPWAVSVPDGAPPGRDKDGKLIVVPENADDVPEEDVKFSFLQLDWDRLAKVKRIIIATDMDEPGERLASELVRRLGRVRCSRAVMPEGCKDLNEVLLRDGSAAVLDVIHQAKPYPVSGLYTVDELPEEPPLNPVSTGWGLLDPNLRVYRPALMVVSGFANAGKSTWTMQLTANLIVTQGWPLAMASFEMRHGVVLEQIERCIAEAIEVHWHKSRFTAIEAAKRMVRSHITLIAPNPAADEETDVPWLLERATAAVIRHGAKMLLIDPWNEVEHRRDRDETTSEYTGRALRMIKRWLAQMEVLGILVVHPTKAGANKSADELTLYDVADCYSSDTEVLTRRGWLPFPQVTLADEVACFDMESDCLCWEQPSRIVRHVFDGEMARFKGRSVDLLVTPGHRMVVMPGWGDPVGAQARTGIGRPTRWPKGRWSFAVPGELPRAGFLIPVAPGMPDGAEPGRIALDHGYAADDFVDLVGWYLAEGHVAGVSVALSQGKAAGLVELRGLVGRMGLDINDRISSAVGVHPRATMDCNTLYVRKRATPELVNWLIEHCGRGSAGKRIPEAIFDLSPRLKRRLIEAFVRGDGHKVPSKRRGEIWSAHTTSPHLRDGLQRLAVECGVSCTVGLAKKVEERHAPSWQLSFVPGRRTIGLDLRNGHLTWERYVGDVWCLTVPTGAFMVRRNGRPAVSGNSAHFANKADLGVMVARLGNPEDTITGIKIAKVRYQPEAGRPGNASLVYDRERRLFGQ